MPDDLFQAFCFGCIAYFNNYTVRWIVLAAVLSKMLDIPPEKGVRITPLLFDHPTTYRQQKNKEHRPELSR
jgi:hypothetical protein